ncbi:MAG TPA: DUF3243 domain-containing protein [Pseudogracilibacillus sp.]|nr:DUF3243 domain-containing protein [Pseudogracilibacillus sp.]
MSVLDNFSSWKEFLANRVEAAQNRGMSNETMSDLAQHVGNYLSDNVTPENKEEQLLKELWNAASEEEQRALANTMIKLVNEK